MLFKICIKPSFNLEELKEAGYESNWKYFVGQSHHNASYMDGQVIKKMEMSQEVIKVGIA